MSQAFKSIAGMEVRTEICRCAGLQDCRTNTRHNFTFQIYLLAEYVDFFAFGITALISGQVFSHEVYCCFLNKQVLFLDCNNILLFSFSDSLFWYEGVDQAQHSVHPPQCLCYSVRADRRSLARSVGHSPAQISSYYYCLQWMLITGLLMRIQLVISRNVSVGKL